MSDSQFFPKRRRLLYKSSPVLFRFLFKVFARADNSKKKNIWIPQSSSPAKRQLLLRASISEPSRTTSFCHFRASTREGIRIKERPLRVTFAVIPRRSEADVRNMTSVRRFAQLKALGLCQSVDTRLGIPTTHNIFQAQSRHVSMQICPQRNPVQYRARAILLTQR